MFIATLGLEHAARTDFYSSVVLAVPLVMSVNTEHLPHGLCEVTLFPVEVSKYFREIFLMWANVLIFGVWFCACTHADAWVCVQAEVRRCFGFLGAGNAGVDWLAVLVLRSELRPSLFSKYFDL